MTRKEAMQVTIQDEKFVSEVPPIGYITQTKLPNGNAVVYGVFGSQDEAIAFGRKLIYAIIKPIYPAVLH